MAEVERPNVLARALQRGMSGWSGTWTVQLDDGSHVVSTIIKMGLPGSRLTVSADGQEIDSGAISAFLGEIRRFHWHGHEFALRVKGFGLTGELALSMDGTELTPGGAAPVAVAPEPSVPASSARVPATPRFLREIDVLESDEVLNTETYPLDNSVGEVGVTHDLEISRTSSNEFTVEAKGQISGSVDARLLSLIEAEVAADLSRKTGVKVGETVTKTQTLHMAAGPREAVLHRVRWSQTVRTGQRVYEVDGSEITVPYRLTYGLTCEVKTEKLEPHV